MSANLALTKIKLGDSATPANNFLISVPDTADGTLTIEREDGTDVLTIDAIGKVAFPGNAQTWQDMTGVGGRALGVPITNNTGQTIKINVTLSFTVANGTAQVTISSVVVQGSAQPTAGQGSSLYAEIPAGASYVVSGAGTGAAIYKWMELR